MFFPEKDLLEKAAAINSPLGKELKKQTSVAEKQYKKFGNTFEYNKNEEVKTKKKRNRANNYFTFYKYNIIKEFAKRSLDSKLNDLIEIKYKLELFYYKTIEIKPNNEDQIKDLEKEELCLIQLLNYIISF